MPRSTPQDSDGSDRRPILLFVITESWYFRSHRLALALAAVEAGWDVHVATRVEPGESFPSALTIHPLPWRRGGRGPFAELRAWFALVRLMRRLKPTLVHAVALKAILFASSAARVSGDPVLVNAVAGLGYAFTAETTKARRMRHLVAGALRRTADRPGNVMLFQNADDARTLKDAGALRHAETVIIRGAGVDGDHFRPADEPSGRFTIGVVARMVAIKGIADVVEASRILAARGLTHEVLLVGAPDIGNPAAIARETLETWSRSATVTWLGASDDVRSVWARCHLAVLASHGGEGLPKSLLEAAACGRAIVATDVPGNREIALPGENAIRVPPGSPTALADAIETLARDDDTRHRYAARSRAIVEEHFLQGAIEAETLALYRRVADVR